MAKEIERKFLVNGNDLGFLTGITPIAIKQGYLSKSKASTVRVRQADDRAFLTIKGPTTNLSCEEFEDEIHLAGALLMLENNCIGGIVEKNRYMVEVGAYMFEVDVFKGKLSGLVVAEVEIESEDAEIEIPIWAGKEVSLDFRYKNSSLADAESPPSE